MHERGRGSALLVALLLAGCGSQRRDAAKAAPDATAPTPATTPSSAVAVASSVPPSPYRTDPLWQRAADEDPLERARLAGAVGAVGLMEALDAGEPVATTALGALPYADDADLALGRLADLAVMDDTSATAGPTRPNREAVLEAILAIAGRPRRPREIVDAEGARRCADAVIALAARRDLPHGERALAISAARALAERGFHASAPAGTPARTPGLRDLDGGPGGGANIPVDLDPH